MAMFVVCLRRLDPWIRVRCAVADGIIIHDYTDEKFETTPGSHMSTGRNRKKQLLIRDTPQDASTPVDGTLSCRETPTSVGPSPTCWLSKQKTILTNRTSVGENTSHPWRACLQEQCKKGRRSTFNLACLQHNSNFDNKVRKTQSLTSSTKTCSLLTDDFLNE